MESPFLKVLKTPAQELAESCLEEPRPPQAHEVAPSWKFWDSLNVFWRHPHFIYFNSTTC